jgi:hypothetical protein
MHVLPLLAAATAALVLSATAHAQWATFQDQTATRLNCAPALGVADPQEKDYAWADFDQDGDTDLVVVRKSPHLTTGHFPNVFLRNENGVLTDRTATLASASLVAGSQGMLDATNDTDAVVVDVNGDGWPDLVTATTLTASQPQHIRVPRVYLNLGNQLGVWQGFLYDDPLRIDDMQPGASWNGEHRFATVTAGDVDADGDLDLYFGDYQLGGPRTVDVNDRLLLNNGAGYFTDATAARMTAVMTDSMFTVKAAMVDMNLDGRLDIVKADMPTPNKVSIAYNTPANPGFFAGYQIAFFAPVYGFSVGDLNNDNLPDLACSDDGQDRYLLHTGAFGGQATFGSPIPFSYSGGGFDDGFAGNNLIVDLNNDGWNDVVIADVDPEVPGCGRRTHIYRNLGNAPSVTLQEQLVGGAVCGIPTAMLAGTFDVAVFDINGDGWKDLVLGQCTGTRVWINQPPLGIQFTVVGGMPALQPPGTPLTLDVVATGSGGVVPQAGTGRLWYSTNGAPFQSVVMADLGPGLYRGTLPATACTNITQLYFAADGQNSVTYTHPATAPATTLEIAAAAGTTPVLIDHNEGVVSGWTVVNDPTLTGGAWQVAVPIGTVSGINQAAPPEDGEPGPIATKCQVTQNGLPGGAAGAADVDGGPTDLVSPLLNFAGSDGYVRYRRWFFSSTSEDVLLVQVTNDGTNWVTVESVAASGNNQWLERSFRVGRFVSPTATVQVRFRANDVLPASIVEAGVDVFRAEVLVCTPCQLQVPLATNGNAFLSVCGSDMTTPGAVSTLRVVSMPPSTTGLLLFDLPILPTPWNGGTLVSPAPVVVGPLFADATGAFTTPVPLGGLLPPGGFLHAQVVYLAPPLPAGVGQTNAVHLQW